MTRTTYYTATTLDGYIADPGDSLDWLLVQDVDANGPMNYETFIAGVGAIVMGATTYVWIRTRIAGGTETFVCARYAVLGPRTTDWTP